MASASTSDDKIESTSENASSNVIKAEKKSNSQAELTKYVMNMKIKREQNIYGTFEIAHMTVELLKTIISKGEWTTAEDIINILTLIGHKLVRSSLKHSYIIGNMFRRILKIIRVEYHTATSEKDNEGGRREPNSLHTIMTRTDIEDYSKVVDQLRVCIIDHITEYQMELETSFGIITKQAKSHIHSNEVIMTIGYSNLLEDFLLAAKEQNFRALVVETEWDGDGRKLAEHLGEAGITTDLIRSQDVNAMMPIVNKVILVTHTIMADGGLRAKIGSRNLAQSANYHKKPVLVVSPLYKLSAKNYATQTEDIFVVMDSPLKVIPSNLSKETIAKSKFPNPVYGWLPPEIITLYITNVGGFDRSYIYRLLSELYHPDEEI